MHPFAAMTFEEGYEKHFLYCRQRNLSETALVRYRACYSLYYKFFDPDLPLNKLDEKTYNRFKALIFLQLTMIYTLRARWVSGMQGACFWFFGFNRGGFFPDGT